MLIEPPDEPTTTPAPPSPDASGALPGWAPVDVADGAVAVVVLVVERAVRLAGVAAFLARPVTALAWVPLALGRQLRAVPWVDGLIARGARERHEATRRAYGVAQLVAPRLVDSVLGLVDLDDVVQEHVDIDGIVAGVDLDQIVDRIDVNAIVARADVDAIIAKLDIDGIVAGVDLQRIVDRIDVNAIVARADVDAIIAKLDIDGIVAGVDLQRIIDRIDVNAIVARADIDAVIAKVDIVALAEVVVEGIDLPGIIRTSTGSMASEGIREVRRQGLGADERVAHVVDRLLHRPERAPGPIFEAGDGAPPTRPQIRREWGGPDPGGPDLAP